MSAANRRVVAMSLRHALLGLLSEEPQSGWDLSRRFAETLGAVWPAGHPQIYGELRKLHADDLITVHETGPRGRVVYAVTPAGKAEVTRWLTDDPVDHTMRLEPILRSVFFWLLPRHAAGAPRRRGRALPGDCRPVPPARGGEGSRRLRRQRADPFAAHRRRGGHPDQPGPRRLGRVGEGRRFARPSLKI